MRKEVVEDKWSDFDYVLKQVKQDGYYLQYASSELRNNKEIVLAAVRQNGTSLQDASKNLKNNYKVVLEAVKNNYAALCWLSSKKFMDDETIILAALNSKKACKINDEAILYASKRLKNDVDFLLKAIEQNNNVIQHISQKMILKIINHLKNQGK